MQVTIINKINLDAFTYPLVLLLPLCVFLNLCFSCQLCNPLTVGLRETTFQSSVCRVLMAKLTTKLTLTFDYKNSKGCLTSWCLTAATCSLLPLFWRIHITDNNTVESACSGKTIGSGWLIGCDLPLQTGAFCRLRCLFIKA